MNYLENKNIEVSMYYRIKVAGLPGIKTLTCLTEELNFANAAYKVIKYVGNDAEIEEIKLMKNFKPAINEKFADTNKLYMVKIAEDIELDNGKIKTIKYDLPAFANDSNQLHDIVNKYIAQGLDNMRLTTISETKWIWI